MYYAEKAKDYAKAVVAGVSDTSTFHSASTGLSGGAATVDYR